jgi:ABC-type uncharacterized transport system involved in gliding motility auxiliary subunit
MLKGQKLFSGAGLVAVVLLLIAINLAAGLLLKGVRLDMTENRLYTLSEGTKNILGQLDEKITLRFYFSERQFSGMPAMASYGQRVRELLEQYVELADGRIELVIKDPEPFSDEEAEAMHYRLQGVPIDNVGSLAYFGLTGVNAAGGWRALPYFKPEQEESLEYELSGLIHGLANPERPVVGLLSKLPLDGGAANPFLPETPEWFILTQIKRSFDVQDLGDAPVSIPENVDVLMVVHPKQLEEKTLFAIDQYVLGGGRVLVFLDPYAEGDQAVDTPMEEADPLAGVTSQRASDLGPLLAAWGVELIPHMVAADRRAATRIKSTVGGQDRGVVDYVAWLTLREENFSSGDFVSSRLNSLVMGSAGILRKWPGVKTDFTPLVATSDQSMPIDAASIQFFTSPEELLQAYRPGGESLVVAARVSGHVGTAFPEGINGAGDRLTQSSEPANVIIVADTDMLRDMFWVSFQDYYGRRAALPSADNDTFVINALDNLSGSNDLISLRSRGRSVRPFEKVADLRAAADQDFRGMELLLQEKLSETGHKLKELQKSMVSESGELVMNDAQMEEINRFRAEHIKIRKDLRSVQHALSKDIELLGTRLKMINIGLVPLVVIVLATILGVVRMRRAARGQ